MCKGVKLFVWLMFLSGGVCFAQQDSIRYNSQRLTKLDSLQLGFLDNESIKVIDTITPKLLMPQDSLLQIRILDSLTNGYRLETFSLEKFLDRYALPSDVITFEKGTALKRNQLWVLGVLAVVLIFFAILKNTFSKELSVIISSFYSNRALMNLNREESMITSWSFLLLFIQFGFTLGLFFFVSANYRSIPEAFEGLKILLMISGGVIGLYLLKILALRFIGFVFELQRPIAEYTTILYLSYFNASLLFVPLITAFILSPALYGNFFIILGIILLGLIFVSQFFRAAFTILSQYRFPKVYLFLYFCTLEICPMLILIKAIGL